VVNECALNLGGRLVYSPQNDRTPATEHGRALQGVQYPSTVLLRRQVLDRQEIDAHQRLRDSLRHEVRVVADNEDGGDGRGHAAMLPPSFPPGTTWGSPAGECEFAHTSKG